MEKKLPRLIVRFPKPEIQSDIIKDNKYFHNFFKLCTYVEDKNLNFNDTQSNNQFLLWCVAFVDSKRKFVSRGWKRPRWCKCDLKNLSSLFYGITSCVAHSKCIGIYVRGNLLRVNTCVTMYINSFPDILTLFVFSVNSVSDITRKVSYLLPIQSYLLYIYKCFFCEREQG